MRRYKRPAQIRTAGLKALREALGADGMVRFLQQFDPGSGDWAKQRRKWVDKTNLAEIRKLAAELPKRRRRSA